ncbi:heparan-alpha-glucosaminide N-acetyltransferase [Aureococcus anophagefferens]|nr:heparan-alpha-glucosaminide N-acetyltransferase [Aureococcus anophagefferens]
MEDAELKSREFAAKRNAHWRTGVLGRNFDDEDDDDDDDDDDDGGDAPNSVRRLAVWEDDRRLAFEEEGARECGKRRPSSAESTMLVNEPESARRPPRVRSLDVVRGFAVLLMIFVDDAGSAYAVLDHSPWDGLTIADVVMPFFIFMVGVSAALALGGKRTLAPVLRRGAALWVVGVAVQGGGLPDPTTYAWGYDLGTVRWCGILQRIAACYVVASRSSCARRARAAAASRRPTTASSSARSRCSSRPTSP